MSNNNDPDKNEDKVEHIADIVGEWGVWQLIVFCFVFCLWIITALNNMGYTFYSYEVEYWCSDVPNDYPNKTEHMKCYKFSNPSEKCNEWNYSNQEMSRTIITEFNLVCDRSNLASLTQSCYMWGYMISGVLFGYISDKYGRRPMIWLSISIEIFALSFSALSTNIVQYLISRLLIGIVAECGGPKYRSDIIAGSGMGWIVGYVALPVLAYLLRDYKLMHWFSVGLFSLMLIWFYFLWESPRWLISNGQIDRAKEVLRYANKVNKLSAEDFDQKFSKLTAHLQRAKLEEEQSKSKTKVSIFDLVRTPALRRNTLILCYSSVVIALVYYGFSLNMADFGGNFYVSFVMSGLVELPSLLALMFFVRYAGRKKSYEGSLVLVLVACLAVIPLSGNSWLSVTFALLGKFGVTFAWGVLDVYSPEIFPTILRNTGLAVLLTIGRVGSSIAPFMKNLAAEYSLTAVMIFYALIISVSAFLTIFLPETKGKEIPDSVEEAENMRKHKNKQVHTIPFITNGSK